MKFRLPSRSFGHQKIAIVLNVLCLSVAFAVLFIVVKQVRYDFNYDSCYPEAENIYQLIYCNATNGKHEGRISMPVIHEAIGAIPEVEHYTILWSGNYSVSVFCADKEYREICLDAYPGFLEVFQPRILAGDAEEALKNRSGVVIPQSLAKKWFGQDNPIGRSIGCGNKNNLWLVKAVYEDFPENSSFVNGIITTLRENNDRSEWSYYCFLRLGKEADGKETEQKIVRYNDSLYLARSNGGERCTDFRRYELLPMEDIYFYPEMRNTLKETGHGNRAITLTLLAIGILIIVVAYINFVNFSTALAPIRISAFNIFRINGASRGRLMRSIVAEAMGLSLLGWLFSLLWIHGFSETVLAKAYFSASLSPWENWDQTLSMGIAALLLGILSGAYPAYYMTSFQPAMVLKGSFALSAAGRRLRNGLLVFQFVATMVLIIASLFVLIQHHYLRDLPLGYPKENIVYIPLNSSIKNMPEVYRSELMKNPDVLDVTASRYLPGFVPMGWGRMYMDTMYINFYAWPVAPDFLTFLGIPTYQGDTLRQPPAGRDFAILNRSMVEKYGLQESIGKEVFAAFRNPVTVLGFAENVNFASLHHKIEPMAFICGDDMWYEYLLIKIRPERTHETMDYLKDCFAHLGLENCDIAFLDDFIDRLYRQEENMSRLISLFCSITVIISLAGIYGLILFNIRYKVKEVGIRKINGASGYQMLWMLNRIFLRLIMIGFIVAVPLGYLLVDRWLDSYPYRTPIQGWVFLLAFLLTLVITLITVSWQSWKAANANPVDAVKTE